MSILHNSRITDPFDENTAEGAMPFRIIHGDITKIRADAVVNAANKTLLGGGGVDGAIHRAAGFKLLLECRTLGGCETGKAKITGGYNMPCRYIIHTVGPVWRGGNNGEEELLYSCYKNSLELAKENGCESIAFPLISAGAYGYPKDEAVSVALRAIADFLERNEMKIALVVFRKDAVLLREEQARRVSQYLADNYTELPPKITEPSLKEIACAPSMLKTDLRAPESVNEFEDTAAFDKLSGLDEALAQLDMSFSQKLLMLIDRSGKTDAQIYKRANIDRKLFSKIRSDIHYRPKKPTVLAFAIALDLSLDETEALLNSAGFALSHSNKADVIVEYFIGRGNYDIYEINEALFSYDQPLIGG